MQEAGRDGSMRNVVEISLSLQLVLLKHFAEHLQAYFFPFDPHINPRK